MRRIHNSKVPQEKDGTTTADSSRDLILKSALVRTQLAAENTLLAWVRTSVSLYGFGFSITKFFAFLAQQRDTPKLSTGAHRLGLALVCVGILALLFAIVEHIKVSRKLKELGLPITRLSLPVYTAAILLVIGIVTLVSVSTGWPF
jgi:putative membrane protein